MFLNFFYFLAGNIFGSFLNVVIYRVPRTISIIYPRSHCTNCKKTIPLFINIPIISFFLLRGKCKYCNKKISILYPIVESITGLLFVFSFNYFYFYEIYTFIIITSLLLCIAIIDFKHFIIPIKLFLLTFIFTSINVFINGNVMFYIYGMGIGFGYLVFIFILTWLLLKKQPMGLGDILLITVLGLWLGPFKILLSIFFSSVVGIFYWGLISIIRGFKKDRRLPFGSFLSIVSIIIYIIKL